MTEIAAALRETRRSASRLSPFSIIDGQSGGNRLDGVGRGDDGRSAQKPDATPGPAGSTRTAALRDEECRRLLAENGRLNERILFLLDIIDREQTRNAELMAGPGRDEITCEVRAALEAELRPVLLVLLRLLEKRQPAAVHATPGQQHPRAARPAGQSTLGSAAYDGNGIIDLDGTPH